VQNPEHHEPHDARHERCPRREQRRDRDVRRDLRDGAPLTGYLAALAVTLAVEPPLWALALRRLGVPARRGYAVGLLGNATSHPLTWLVLFRVLPGPRGAAFVVVEAFAVGWEAAVARVALRRDLPALLGVSLLANAASLLAGVLPAVSGRW
jgi:type IV secretory pathway VirB2 component (pilin)